jgi:hypothetical protein
LVLHAVVSIAFPTASPRSPPKRANSARPENGQRLAGYVAYCLPRNPRPQSLLLAKFQDPSVPIPDWSRSLCRWRLLAINGARLADGTTPISGLEPE